MYYFTSQVNQVYDSITRVGSLIKFITPLMIMYAINVNTDIEQYGSNLRINPNFFYINNGVINVVYIIPIH